MRYIYLLELSNGHIYTGCTNDLRRRLREHGNGNVASTHHFRPLRLIHYEVYMYDEDANRRERYLKTTEGKRFLRQQIKVYFASRSGEVAEWLKAAPC